MILADEMCQSAREKAVGVAAGTPLSVDDMTHPPIGARDFNQHSITNAGGQEDGLSQEQQELVHLFYRFLGESAWGAEPLTVACPACLAGLCFGAWHRAPRWSPYGSSPKV